MTLKLSYQRSIFPSRPGLVGRAYGGNVAVSHDDHHHLGPSIRQQQGAGHGGDAGSLNRILNNTTANIIDIGMIGQTPGMPDQQEVNERQAVYRKRLRTCGADLAARHRHQQRGQSTVPELPVSQLRLLLESGPDPGDVTLVSQMARRVEAAITSIRVEQGQAILVPFGVNQIC